MPEPGEFRAERDELQSVLRSNILVRAPHLVSFLNYVCGRYFKGEADQIKEYTIGVEAFRRLPDFDPKRDSIVRVEAHRLRKRLEEYYATTGAGHRVRIVIPNGQYVPQFIFLDQPAEVTPCMPPENSKDLQTPTLSASSADPAPASVIASPVKRGPKLVWFPALLLGVVGSVVLFGYVRHREGHTSRREEVWTGTATQPVPAEFRMLAGYRGPSFTDRQGHIWSPDSYFSGGFSTPIAAGHIIEGEPEPNLVKTQRSGTFRYDIPLAPGSYELRLYFVETEYGPGNPLGGGETARMFRVFMNGVEVVKWLDPICEAGGPNRLVVRDFKDVSPAADGKLHLVLSPFLASNRAPSPAFLNALEILQSKPGFIHPIRIVTQDRPVTDADGHTWSSDEYYFGGALGFRSDLVVNAHDDALYRGERYGNFAYHIPLAPGKYRLTLHFAETWFGTPNSNEPGPGSRVFNVFANGAALLRDFDIAKEAGVNREVVKVFDNLQPNAQGSLWLEFIPVANYAEVNAIEVEETQ
jgi:Malectin domain